MIREVVGTRHYNVWTDMLRRLVPHGRTHRLSVVVAGMLQVTREIAHTKEKANAKARYLSDIFKRAYKHDEENGIRPLLELTEQLFKDAGVRFKRVSSKGQAYSIAEAAVQQFLYWESMPWEP